MKKGHKSYLELCALLGKEIDIGYNLPTIKMPLIKDISYNLYVYLNLVDKYLDLYERKRDDIWLKIVSSENESLNFLTMVSFFSNVSDLEDKKGVFSFGNGKYISYENIDFFMKIIRVLHHRDSRRVDYKPANTLAQRMMEEARRRKAAIEKKKTEMLDKAGIQEDVIGFIEIISSISARHPSLNLSNICDLNYYQIINQYNRLLKIDKYTPCLVGNATEEYIKENKVKHYSFKIFDE